MNADVSIVAALIGGILSFLSPCVLPLVPAYLVYLAGASARQLANVGPSFQRRSGAVLTAGLFVAGFSTVFVALGAGASAMGALLRSYFDELAIVAGGVVILMGLHFLGVIQVGLFMRYARVEVRRPAGLLGAYVMGLAFGFGWTPCIGPILAAILAIAASEATVAKGAGLLAVYAIGLGLPFIAASLVATPFTVLASRFRSRLAYVERTMGVFLILTGMAFLTGTLPYASFWLLETFPTLGQIG